MNSADFTIRAHVAMAAAAVDAALDRKVPTQYSDFQLTVVKGLLAQAENFLQLNRGAGETDDQRSTA